MIGNYSRFCFVACPPAPACQLNYLPSPCICQTPAAETTPGNGGETLSARSTTTAKS
jgi:hypothetical protein